MRIEVARTVATASHTCIVFRSDGTQLQFPMLDHAARLPHDLTHFAVESELGLSRGFWGLLASGVMFDGAEAISAHGGRVRRRRLTTSQARYLEEVEVLVAALAGLWERNEVDLEVEGMSARGRRACFVGLDRLQHAWERTDVGERLVLDWAVTEGS